MMTYTLILLYFLLLFTALFFKTREIKSPWLFYLRAFFPNWKFFHAIGYAPRLYVQVQRADGLWLDWQVLYPRVKRSIFDVFHNPHVNLHLANQNLIEHFVGDLNQLKQGDDASQFVTYSLICKLARSFALQSHFAFKAFRFEVRMEMPQLNHPFEPKDIQVMLASPALKNE